MFKILILAFLACASATDFRKMFSEAMDKYRVKNGIEEMEPAARRKMRFEAFVKFAKLTAAINANKNSTFKSINNFLSILTDEERQSRLGLNITGELSTGSLNEQPALTTNLQVAQSRDFSSKISPVKDQGSCGSCWTFSATAALEGEIYFTTGTEGVSLSEQEYMECSTYYDGCGGGWMEDCYTYSVREGRIAPTNAYLYSGRDAMWCQSSGRANALTQTNIKIIGNIPIQGDYNLLQYADQHIVSVAISVVDSFYGYSTGVYNEYYCDQVNHAVAVVGFGSDYWLVRNSWGQAWGTKGHIKMSRYIDNICGISSYAIIPKVQCADENCRRPDIGGGGEEFDDGNDDNNDDGNGDCNADAGLVFCYDCNCCKHIHMCYDY